MSATLSDRLREFDLAYERISSEAAQTEIEQLETEVATSDRILASILNNEDTSLAYSRFEDTLDELAEVAAILGLKDPTLPNFYSAISRADEDEYALDMSLSQLSAAEEELEHFVAVTQHREESTTRWTQRLSSTRPTSEIETERRLLLSKAKEYQEELKQLEASSSAYRGHPTVSDIIARQDALARKRKELEDTKKKVKAYQGLPPDVDLARIELEGARENLFKLQRQRDDILSRIAAKVS